MEVPKRRAARGDREQQPDELGAARQAQRHPVAPVHPDRGQITGGHLDGPLAVRDVEIRIQRLEKAEETTPGWVAKMVKRRLLFHRLFRTQMAAIVDGRLADCYAGIGLDEETLTREIFGGHGAVL